MEDDATSDDEGSESESGSDDPPMEGEAQALADFIASARYKYVLFCDLGCRPRRSTPRSCRPRSSRFRSSRPWSQ